MTVTKSQAIPILNKNVHHRLSLRAKAGWTIHVSFGDVAGKGFAILSRKADDGFCMTDGKMFLITLPHRMSDLHGVDSETFIRRANRIIDRILLNAECVGWTMCVGLDFERSEGSTEVAAQEWNCSR